MTKLLFTILIFTQYNVHSYMTVNKYDISDCALNLKLVQEIASYKNITKTIMNEVINNGDTFYNE